MLFFRPFINKTCIYTVLFTITICLVGLWDGQTEASIRLVDFLWTILFCAILALASGILNITKMKGSLRRIIHYSLCLIAFFFLSLVTDRIPEKGSSILIFFVVFTVVYLAIYFLDKLFRIIRRAIMNA